MSSWHLIVAIMVFRSHNCCYETTQTFISISVCQDMLKVAPKDRVVASLGDK